MRADDRMEGPLVLLVKSIDDVREAVEAARASGKVVGLVPTMGALHAGHVALIERCRAEAGFVVVSIFVNPTQFGPREDFARYPRTLEDDLARCAEGGADLVFAPDAAVMYPHGLDLDVRRGAGPVRTCSKGPAGRGISGGWRPSSSSSSRSSGRTSPSSG